VFYWREYYGNTVDFTVRDPDGRELIPSSRETLYEGSTVATTPGSYQFVFDNAFSLLAAKVVDFYYEIQDWGH
jgi:hypothetical protein